MSREGGGWRAGSWRTPRAQARRVHGAVQRVEERVVKDDAPDELERKPRERRTLPRGRRGGHDAPTLVEKDARVVYPRKKTKKKQRLSLFHLERAALSTTETPRPTQTTRIELRACL